ncbi:hypothetical protein [Flavobacterium davisii]|uniref:hypothetical protein n=1 Tax=Flavobacterium davisii TaxID=2906077 RepID=UPI0013FE006A|nr:hypothetical protein [Flavobacterium davisii]
MPYTAKIEVEIPENSRNFFPKSGVDGKNIDNTGKLIGGRSKLPQNLIHGYLKIR